MPRRDELSRRAALLSAAIYGMSISVACALNSACRYAESLKLQPSPREGIDKPCAFSFLPCWPLGFGEQPSPELAAPSSRISHDSSRMDPASSLPSRTESLLLSTSRLASTGFVSAASSTKVRAAMLSHLRARLASVSPSQKESGTSRHSSRASLPRSRRLKFA